MFYRRSQRTGCLHVDPAAESRCRCGPDVDTERDLDLRLLTTLELNHGPRIHGYTMNHNSE